jgi:outer membrane murein-binding lipoprotein Lpp
MNLSSINLRFFANIAPMVGGLNKAERKLDQTGRKFESIGKSLTKSISVPMAAIGTLSVAVFSGFEAKMSEVKAISGATADQFQKLRANAEQLGASTIFTAKDVAQLQVEFAKLGFTADEITKVTEATLYLAQASGTDLARAAEVAGATLRGFGLDATETNRVTDVMALSFSRSALDMEKFAESMKYVAPIANAAGVSLEETTALLGVLANAGISGSQAGTSLRRILTDLGSESGTTSEKIAKLAAKGISMENAMDDVGRSAQSALLVLQKNVDSIPNLTKQFDNASGSAKGMAEIMGDNLQGSMKAFQSASEGALIQIGELVSVAFRPLVDIATAAISAFNNMNPTIKKIIVGFAMATATIGPAILAVGGLVRTFAMLKAAMMAANPTLLAVSLTIGAIGALMMTTSTAMQGATGELIRHKTEANSLISVIGDANVSQETRNALIDKFNTKFGSYIGNIDKEKTSIEDLAKFQKQFNDELARKIKMAAMEKVLTREMEKAAEAQAKIIDAETLRSNLQKELATTGAEQLRKGNVAYYNTLTAGIQNATKTIEIQTEKAKELTKGVANLQSEMERMNPSMESAATTTAAAGDAAENAATKVDKLKEKYVDLNSETGRLASLQGQYLRAMASEVDQQLKTDIDFLPAMEPIDMDDLVDPVVFTELPAGFAKLKDAAMDLSANISAAITGAAGDFAVGIGEMIGSAMAGGEGFKNFGTFALQTLAALLRQLGEMAIAAGLAVDSIKVALKSMTGAGAIAAGIALIALSSGIQTSMAKKANSMGGGGIPALAEGGIATGPTLALIGEGRGPEAVIPLDKLEGMMTGGFGGQNVVVTGRIQGSDILIANERASRERSRYRGF